MKTETYRAVLRRDGAVVESRIFTTAKDAVGYLMNRLAQLPLAYFYQHEGYVLQWSKADEDFTNEIWSTVTM